MAAMIGARLKSQSVFTGFRPVTGLAGKSVLLVDLRERQVDPSVPVWLPGWLATTQEMLLMGRLVEMLELRMAVTRNSRQIHAQLGLSGCTKNGVGTILAERGGTALLAAVKLISSRLGHVSFEGCHVEF